MPRQRLHRTAGIVLRRLDLSEADRIVTLYTRERGKTRAVAKGARRTTSRLAGHLELFALADVLLAQGRELDVVSQADTAQSFRHVREDVGLISHAYYVAELVDLFTEDHLPNVAAFETLVEAFQALDEGVEPRLAVLAFLARFLGSLGYRPELSQCLACRAEVAPGANQFSSLLGGVLCPTCGPREVSAQPLGTEALKLVRHLQRTAGQPRLTAPDQAVREAESVLRAYAEYLVERRMRAPALIQRVQQAADQAGL